VARILDTDNNSRKKPPATPGRIEKGILKYLQKRAPFIRMATERDPWPVRRKGAPGEKQVSTYIFHLEDTAGMKLEIKPSSG
jgi:hypothetical protein